MGLVDIISRDETIFLFDFTNSYPQIRVGRPLVVDDFGCKVKRFDTKEMNQYLVDPLGENIADYLPYFVGGIKKHYPLGIVVAFNLGEDNGAILEKILHRTSQLVTMLTLPEGYMPGVVIVVPDSAEECASTLDCMGYPIVYLSNNSTQTLAQAIEQYILGKLSVRKAHSANLAEKYGVRLASYYSSINLWEDLARTELFLPGKEKYHLCVMDKGIVVPMCSAATSLILEDESPDYFSPKHLEMCGNCKKSDDLVHQVEENGLLTLGRINTSIAASMLPAAFLGVRFNETQWAQAKQLITTLPDYNDIVYFQRYGFN